MYDFIVDLIGVVPDEFEFIYSILTIVFAMLTLSFLFQLFYIPLEIIRK